MRTHQSLKSIALPIKTVCILLSLMFLTGIIQIIMIELYWEFQRTHWDLSLQENVTVDLTEQEKRQIEISNAVKSFTEDGTIYLVITEVTPGTFQSKYIVKNTEGDILFEGKEENCPYSFIEWSPQNKDGMYVSNRTMNQYDLNELDLIGPEFSRNLIIPIVNPYNKRIGHWFFDTDKHIFKYYDIQGRSGGYLGANGYAETEGGAVAFETCVKMQSQLRPNSYDPMMTYETEFAVYEIDFQNKHVNTLVHTEDPIRDVSFINWLQVQDYDYRPAMIVRTNANKLYLHFKNPDQFIETQLPEDLPYYGSSMFAANDETIYARYEEILGRPKTNDIDAIVEWLDKTRNKPKDHRIHLYEVDKNGIFTELSSFTWAQPATQPNVVVRSTRETMFVVVNSVSSPVPRWLAHYWLITRNYQRGPVWLQPIMDFVIAYSEFKTPINLCVMTVFAALAFLHAWPRRTQIAKLIFWIVFVFLFNLPGLLTYLALNHTPVIRCVNCGKKRGLQQDACCRCGTALPKPKAKETDLVMPLSA